MFYYSLRCVTHSWNFSENSFLLSKMMSPAAGDPRKKYKMSPQRNLFKEQ